MCRRRIWFYSSASKFDTFSTDLDYEYNYNDYIREPVLFGVVFCVSDKIYNPFSGEETDTYKSDFVYYIILIDLVVIFTTIYMINFLGYRYKQYASLYDKRAVEMRDFTCRITNLPKDFEFGGKEQILQAQLWNHIEISLQRAIERGAKRMGDGAALGEARKDKVWEIVDITFARSNLDEQELLEQLDEKDRERKKLLRDVQIINEDKENDRSGEIPGLEQQISEKTNEYDIMKKEYIRIQEEQLYDKYEITEENGRTEDDQSVQAAYVIFRSMQGKDKCLQCFQYAQQNAKLIPGETEKMFFGRWLRFSSPAAPTSMIWKHQVYSDCNRLARTIIIWILAGIVIVLAFYLMVIFKIWNDEMLLEAGINVKCAKEPPTPQEVLVDYEKPIKQRQGYVHCFCLDFQTKNGTIDGSQELFLEVDDSLDTDLCAQWQGFRSDSQMMIIITGAVIGAINGICVFLFEIIPMVFEKCLTHSELTLA